MIDCRGLPILGGVALTAVFPETGLVDILFGMARDAVFGCALEDLVGMAVLAGRGLVLTQQGKSRQFMIDCRGLPILGGVTLTTVLAEITLVRINLGMAGRAILRSRFKNRCRLRPGMALNTSGWVVFAQ